MASKDIQSIFARQVYTKRGYPGVEVVVRTEGGHLGRAECTAGLSIGMHEVAFTYDGGKAFRGKGVQRACDNVNNVIAPALIGMDSTNQKLIDQTMLNLLPDVKAKLGGNGIAALSAAAMKAGACALDIPLYQHIGGVSATVLPVPGVNTVTGEFRYGGPQYGTGKPSYSVMAYDFGTYAEASYACWELLSPRI